MSSESLSQRETQLDDELVQEFAHGFFGYGNLDAPLWFVGMEEGGGDSFEGVAAHLEMWAKLGKAETLDIRESGQHPDRHEHAKWFTESPNIQSTWNPLIRLSLAYQGEELTTEAVRRYQRDELAGSGCNECLLELMPLPSPSTSVWNYPGWSSLPWLQSRDAYEDYLRSQRIQRLRSLVSTHNPAAVVFYGKRYLEHFCGVTSCVPADFEEVDLPRKDGEHLSALIRRTGVTNYVVTYHPSHRPATNLYFESVGKLVASNGNPELTR